MTDQTKRPRALHVVRPAVDGAADGPAIQTAALLLDADQKREIGQSIGHAMRLLLAAESVRSGRTSGTDRPAYDLRLTTGPDGRALLGWECVVTIPGSPLSARFDRLMWPDGGPMWYIAGWDDATHDQRVAALGLTVDYPDPVIE